MAPPAILVEETVTLYPDPGDFSTQLVLSQYAYGLSGFGGRLNGPSVRGANSQSPLGADRNRPHWYGPRQEQWEMWVSSNDPATDLSGGRAQASKNLDVIKGAFLGTIVTGELVIDRLVRLPGITDPTSRRAYAVCKGVDVQTVAAGALHRLRVDVEIPAGVWVGSPDVGSVSGDGTFTTTGSAFCVPDLIELTGNCEVFNDSTNTGFAYTGAAANYYPAQWKTDAPGAIAGLVPSSLMPFTLRPGDNALSFSGSSINITWTEAWA